MALQLDILANTRQFVSESKKAGASLDDIGDSLDDVARESTRAGDKMERSFRDIARDAKKADRAVEDIGDTGGKSFKKLGDTGSEVSGELRQNLGETFSSFRGDLEDLPQIAQDTLGGLAGSGALGGIAGLAATAAGAAGLGLVIAAFEQIRQEQELSEEAIAGWADAFLESGGRVISAAQVMGGVVAQATDPEQYKVASENARNWGVDITTAMRAMAGDATALAAVQGSVSDMQARWNQVVQEGYTDTSDYGAATVNLTKEQVELRNQLFAGSEAFADLTGEMDAGRERARTVSDALKGIVNDSASATVEVDELGNKLFTLPDETQVLVDAETGLATQNVDRFKGDLDGIPQTVNSRVKVNVDDSAIRHWQPPVKSMRLNLNVFDTRGRLLS